MDALDPDVWFEVVAYISDPNDGVRMFQEKYSWLKCFILPSNTGSSVNISPDFQDARTAFELGPAETIRRIERFSGLLKTRDLCEQLVKHLGHCKDEESRGRRFAEWVGIHHGIRNLLAVPAHEEVASFDPGPIRNSLTQLRGEDSGGKFPAELDKLIAFWARSHHEDELQKKKTIEATWRQEHRRSFHAFREHQYTVGALFGEVEYTLLKCAKASRLLSLEQDKFQSNVCLFVEASIGRRGLRYQEAMKVLRELSSTKNEQSKILYEAKEEQRVEIARQRQIITCLEYRHVLENMPQKDRLWMQQILRNKTASPPVWRAMWKLAVEDELDRMILAFLIPQPPPSPPPAGTPSLPPSLRPLLQSESDFAVKNNRQLQADKVTSRVPVLPAGVVPPAPRPTLATHYALGYTTWPSFQCGHNIYGDLSGNVHGYSGSYEVDETNFTKSYRIILNWLKLVTTEMDPVTDDLKWGDEWTGRNLPN